MLLCRQSGRRAGVQSQQVRSDPEKIAVTTLNRALELLSFRFGLSFSQARMQEVADVLLEESSKRDYSSAQEFVADLYASPSLLEEVSGRFTIGESYFFRIPKQFEFISLKAVWELIESSAGKAIRCWSAGCAQGEEAYSLAIAVAKLGLSEQVQIVGTDISHIALSAAKEASYSSWALRDLNREEISSCFTCHNDRYRLKECYRQAVRFIYFNLASQEISPRSAGIEDVDLLLCRNVLIYFSPEGIERVAKNLYASMSPRGFLLTAATDPDLSEYAPFESCYAEFGKYYRRPERVSSRKAVAILPVERDKTDRAPQSINEAQKQTDAIKEAQCAYTRACYALSAKLSEKSLPDSIACKIYIDSLTKICSPDRVEAACQDKVSEHPLSLDLHYYYSIVLSNNGKLHEALDQTKKTLYLNHKLEAAYFLMGTILRRLGESCKALNALKICQSLCSEHSEGELLILADGQCAKGMSYACELQIRAITS